MGDILDLRFTEWREAICRVAEAVDDMEISNRGLALLIADTADVTMTQALMVLEAIPRLRKKYVKPTSD